MSRRAETPAGSTFSAIVRSSRLVVRFDRRPPCRRGRAVPGCGRGRPRVPRRNRGGARRRCCPESSESAAARRQAGQRPAGVASGENSTPHLGQDGQSRCAIGHDSVSSGRPSLPLCRQSVRQACAQNSKRTSPITVRRITSPKTCCCIGWFRRLVARTATVIRAVGRVHTERRRPPVCTPWSGPS